MIDETIVDRLLTDKICDGSNEFEAARLRRRRVAGIAKRCLEESQPAVDPGRDIGQEGLDRRG